MAQIRALIANIIVPQSNAVMNVPRPSRVLGEYHGGSQAAGAAAATRSRLICASRAARFAKSSNELQVMPNRSRYGDFISRFNPERVAWVATGSSGQACLG